MALPYSPHQLSVPIVMYDPNVPPVMPSIAILPQIEYLVSRIASEVANEASRKANSSPARMFCYNMLVDNYWNNSQFAEVVKLSADHICLMYKKGLYRVPEAGITDSVSQILTLYTSNIIFQYPELKSICSPQTIDAAFQNVPAFNNLMTELQQMYHNNAGDNRFGWGAPTMGGNAHAPMGSFQSENFNPAGNNYPPNVQMVWTPQGFMPVASNFQDTRFQASYQNSGNSSFSNGRSFDSARSVASFNDNGDMRQDRFFSHPIVKNNEEPNHHVVNLETSTQKQKSVAGVLVIEGGTEMERQQHRLTFLGNTYPANNIERGKQFVDETEKLASANTEADEPSQYVHPVWIAAPTLDQTIFHGKIKQIERQKHEAARGVFRCFAVAVNPILSPVKVQDYMDELRKANTFTELANKLKSLGQALASQKDDKKIEVEGVVCFLNTIDTTLTNIVNDFLRTSLIIPSEKMKPLSIDSFTSDIEDLGPYIHRKYGANFSQGFVRFETDVISTVLEEIAPDVLEAVADNIDLPKDMFFGSIPLNYCLTYVFMCACELGYKLGKDPVVIEQSSAPSLYAIAKSHEHHKKSMGMTTLYDLLITSDGIRYRLTRNYARPDQYLISLF